MSSPIWRTESVRATMNYSCVLCDCSLIESRYRYTVSGRSSFNILDAIKSLPFNVIVTGQSYVCQGGIRVNLTPKMCQSLLNVTPRSQMMPNFTFPLHNYDSKKRLNRQEVLFRRAPTLVKVNDLAPLRQEFSNSAPKIFGVEYTDSTLVCMPHLLCSIKKKERFRRSLRQMC